MAVSKQDAAGNASNREAFAKHLRGFQTSLDELVEQSATHAVTTLPMGEGADAAEAAQVRAAGHAALRGLFDQLSRQINGFGSALSEADAEAHRKGLLSQKTWYEMKLETARTAAAVGLKDQAVKLESDFNRKLETTMQALDSGDTTNLLKEATERASKFEKMADGYKGKLAKADEAVKSLQALLQASNKELAELGKARDEERAKQAGAIAAATQAAEEAAAHAREEYDALAGKHAEAEAAHAAELASLSAELVEAKDRHARSLQEAHQEAERAAMLAAEQCKQEVERMAVRLKAEVEAQSREQREAMGAQLKRLFAELKTMTASLASSEAASADQAVFIKRMTAMNKAEVERLNGLLDEAARREAAAEEAADATDTYIRYIARGEPVKI